MTPEQRQQIETQIQNDFAVLQKKLEDLKNEVQEESDVSKKQEKQLEFDKMKSELDEMKKQIDILSSLQEQALQALKTRLEQYSQIKQNVQGETTELLNQKMTTPTTYELLKNSETYSKLHNIIESNPDKFKNLPGENAEKKLEYIFRKIRESIVQFMENKLGNSEGTEKVINNTIAPAFEWSLMELLREQRNETNVGMLEGMNEISWKSLKSLFDGVKLFAGKFGDGYSKFSQWMNAVDYLSVHNWVLRNPDKSEVLTNPLKFQEYLNDARFSANDFSPYASISDNIFKIDESQTFEFGFSLKEKEKVLSEIGNIQVVNNPRTTALIASMLDKPAKFLQKTEGLQKTANSLLDGINSLSSVTKIFGVDVLGEITKAPEERGFLYKILDFVCKLIGVTGGLEGIVKRWRMDRMNLTSEKNENISQIFKKYKELAGENTSLSITDENSCKTALNDFVVTDLDKQSTTKGDYLRDSIAENMEVSLISPAVVQQVLGDSYLKKETVKEKGKSREKLTVDEAKITENDRQKLAHGHMILMKSHLEKYKDNDLSDFYKNIHSTEDIALCITASLYANKDDVIEGVKASVFLPENYVTIRADGSVAENVTSSGNESEQVSGEVSPYKLSPGDYPFKDVPPYKGIASYDVRDLKMKPVLDYSELTKKHEGVVTLDGSNIKNQGHEYPSNDTKGNRNNNPCDISHSDSDIGYQGASKVADGQALARYDSPLHGIASAMRLLKRKYSNKSITEIDVSGYQGYYKANEEIGLSALRIKWITNQCNALGVGPHQMLDFNDSKTFKSFVAQVAILETGTHIGQKLLDDAYNLAFA